MRRLLAGLIITYASFFAFGYVMAESIRISTRQDQKRPSEYIVTVTLPRVTDQHRWVEAYACSVDFDGEDASRCNFLWERRSLQEVRADQRQYVFAWRPVPRGKLWIHASTTDANWKTLATGQRTVFR